MRIKLRVKTESGWKTFNQIEVYCGNLIAIKDPDGDKVTIEFLTKSLKFTWRFPFMLEVWS